MLAVAQHVDITPCSDDFAQKDGYRPGVVPMESVVAWTVETPYPGLLPPDNPDGQYSPDVLFDGGVLCIGALRFEQLALDGTTFQWATWARYRPRWRRLPNGCALVTVFFRLAGKRAQALRMLVSEMSKSAAPALEHTLPVGRKLSTKNDKEAKKMRRDRTAEPTPYPSVDAALLADALQDHHSASFAHQLSYMIDEPSPLPAAPIEHVVAHVAYSAPPPPPLPEFLPEQNMWQPHEEPWLWPLDLLVQPATLAAPFSPENELPNGLDLPVLPPSSYLPDDLQRLHGFNQYFDLYS